MSGPLRLTGTPASEACNGIGAAMADAAACNGVGVAAVCDEVGTKP